jgi:hypothetical protein
LGVFMLLRAQETAGKTEAYGQAQLQSDAESCK